MNELIQKVEQWAIDRNLHTADSKGQALKVVEEFTETLLAIEQDEEEDVVFDGVGDTHVTLIILCQQQGLEFAKYKKQAESNIGSGVYELNEFVQYPLNMLATGVSKGHKRTIEQGVIGILSALEIVLNKYDVPDYYCLEMAYNEIKDRRGKMIDGVFVKESDLMSSSFSQIEELARQYALTLSENGEGDDELFGRLKKYADEVDVNVTIYNPHLTNAEDSIDEDETLLESVSLTGKWGCVISVKK